MSGVLRALLLEDDVLRGRAMRRQLERQGYHVTWAQTCADACRELCTSIDVGRFDFCSLDFNLKAEHNGLDVVEYIVTMSAPMRPARIEIHSNDDAGAERMLSALSAAGTIATRRDWI